MSRLFDAALKLVQPRLQHVSLGLAVGGKLTDVAAKLLLGLRQPALERGDGLLALPLEPGRHLALALLEPLLARVGDLGEPCAERRLRLPGEVRDGAVELTGEPLRRTLTRRLYLVCELQDRRLREPRRGAFDRALERLDLSALDLGEARLQARRDLALLALELLEPPARGAERSASSSRARRRSIE